MTAEPHGNGRRPPGALQILLAVDGSPSAALARDFLAGLAWPDGTSVRVVAVLEETRALFGLPWMAVAPLDMAQLESEAAAAMRAAAHEAAAALRGADLEAEPVLLRGRPASAIVDEARRIGAQLTVLGSHGHGLVERTLLGSVSTEVVDHAPGSALVVRGRELRRVVLADDGSAEAAAARRLVATWPIFHAVPVTVVSVADPALRPPAEMVAPQHAARAGPWAGAFSGSRALHARLAEESASELAETGLAVSVNVRSGHAATEILRAAAEGGADLVVVGSRGHSALERLLIGSVARHVVLHAACSVLVVRPEPVRRRAVRAGEPVGATTPAV